MALLCIGGFYLVLQGFTAFRNLSTGNLEVLVGSAMFCSIFWLQFYLIWIGVNWIRWLAGAWHGLSGFCFLIWGFRDDEPAVLSTGVINLLIATYFCVSPSVYFFAKRQREKRSWLHSGLVAGAFLLLSISLLSGTIGLLLYKMHAQAEAIDFADEAAEHIYINQEREWMFSHFAPEEIAGSTPESLNAFFVQNVGRLGPVLQISKPTGAVRLIYHFPAQFTFTAQLTADGKSGFGPVRLHFWIADRGDGWSIDRTWWERTYTERAPDYR